MLSELEQRILTELEEAGEENVSAMLNTIIEPSGEARELSDYQSALSDLVVAGLVSLALTRDESRHLLRSPLDVSMAEVEKIATYLKYDTSSSLWRDSRKSGPPYSPSFPQIVCTTEGRQRAFQILDERGYQWWRNK